MLSRDEIISIINKRWFSSLQERGIIPKNVDIEAMKEHDDECQCTECLDNHDDDCSCDGCIEIGIARKESEMDAYD